MDDYVIACRSYKRPITFRRKTYRMLAHNGLVDRLYIFVADEEEKALYEAALDGQPCRQIVVGSVGGAAATRAICAFFPVGQRIVFVDDDLTRFFNWTDGTLQKDAQDLRSYLDDGFASIDASGYGAFTFSFLSNKMFLQGKPRKEFRPFMLAGNFFGTRNDPEMITTADWQSHADDTVRTCRYIHKYGGILLYWWAGFNTNYGQEEGGLQASGERGTAENRLMSTSATSWRIYTEEPLVKAYCQEPCLMAKGTLWSLKLKTLPQIRKALACAAPGC